jgi:hypothetical protein
MAKMVFPEKPGRTNKVRQKTVLTAYGHGLDVRNLLMTAWNAAAWQRFFGATPAAIAQQRDRVFVEAPPLRNCLRCSKAECSTS